MEHYLSFIAYVLGGKKDTRQEWRHIDWQIFYQFAQEQAVLGIVFEGIERFGEELKDVIPKDVLFQWIGDAEQIRNQNGLLNKRCVELTHYFAERGFRSCILKGQGNALMYPNPYRRTPGDIDVWLEAKKEDVVQIVQSVTPDAELKSHHIDFPMFKDVDVEVHFIPSFSVVQRYNKRWLQYVKEKSSEQFVHTVNLPDTVGTVSVPTVDFNIVFQLSHMMRHFFYEGIGLRHVIDYYYLLKANVGHNREAIFQTLKNLGMLRFAEGLMWIEKECLGLSGEFLIARPDVNRGRLILSEIYEGGNFGKNDSRMAAGLSNKSKTLSVIVRNLKLMRLFPEEAVASPIDGVIRRFLKK